MEVLWCVCAVLEYGIDRGGGELKKDESHRDGK